MNQVTTLAVRGRWDRSYVLALLKEQREAAMSVSESFESGSPQGAELRRALADIVGEMERICELLEGGKCPDPAGERTKPPVPVGDEDVAAVVLARRFGRARQRLAAALLRSSGLGNRGTPASEDPVIEDPGILDEHDDLVGDDFEQFARLRLLTGVLLTHLHQDVTPEPDSRWSLRAPRE